MYSYDLHLHTRYSYDSCTGVLKLIERAREIGLKGIAITDHETAAGANYARKINPFDDFEIIVGQEVKTEVGDIIGLFIQNNLGESSFRELCAEIRQQGGVVVLPHPFKKKKEVNLEVARAVDCIEIFNARIKEEENRRAFELCIDLNKPFTVGSDGHTLAEVGRATLLATDDGLGQKGLRRQCDFIGNYSPRYVHYISALIGNYHQGTLVKLLVKKSLPHELRARFGW